jgi:hypothetical protein
MSLEYKSLMLHRAIQCALNTRISLKTASQVACMVLRNTSIKTVPCNVLMGVPCSLFAVNTAYATCFHTLTMLVQSGTSKC